MLFNTILLIVFLISTFATYKAGWFRRNGECNNRLFHDNKILYKEIEALNENISMLEWGMEQLCVHTETLDNKIIYYRDANQALMDENAGLLGRIKVIENKLSKPLFCEDFKPDVQKANEVTDKMRESIHLEKVTGNSMFNDRKQFAEATK